MRQYAEEKLSSIPHEHALVLDRRCRYCAAWLNEREDHITGFEQPTALAETVVEIENLRAGWGWAIERRNLSAIARLLRGLMLFFRFG